MLRDTARILGSGMLVGVVVFAACDESGTAPPSTGSIIGDVTMEGRGLGGVTATLSDGTTATTATDGSFRFDGIAPGTYEVSIRGYPVHAAFGAKSASVTVGRNGARAMVRFGATNSDRVALEALYDSAGGAGWTRKENWGTSAPLGDWYGVTTDANGRVAVLFLSENNLRGTIPAAVGELTRLEFLGLFREPGLTGPIPPELGNLADLRVLALGGNNLTGAIPAELGRLTELTALYLWGNSLTGTIPPELGNLSKLQALQLDGPVVSAPAHADGVPGDSRADVEQPLSGLAAPFQPQARESGDRAAESADIAASRNNVGLTGPIPPGIWNLTDLTLLTLGRNRLTGGIPPAIGNLTKLEQFSVQDNQLAGAIPAALWTLTDLTVLAFSGNQLTGSIPPAIGNFANLEIFWAANNNLSGSIPPEVGSLDSLTHLGLHDNSLTGTVPASLGNLTALVELALSRNDLQGAIPPELGDLGKLEVLYLNQNRLDGGIPPELGALDSLTSLSLRGNELTGAMPPEIGDLSKLVQLWVQANPLSGPLPLEMTQLANLSVFNFSDTRLCVPDDQAFVSWLQSVADVTGSGLDCGSVSGDRDVLETLYNATDGPNWTNSAGWTTNAPLGEWYGVTTDPAGRVVGLDLQDNSLSGPLPTALGSLDKLEELILEDHGISGLIPPELGKLGNLTVLSLGSDSLTGPIPHELGDLTSLKSLGIGGSPLTGSIPPELGNLANLETLLLAGTDISDSIPPELGNLGNLTLLILNENNLSGAIPGELGNLSQLDALSLQDNDLSGPVPPELGNLSQLEALFLDDNLLTGQVPESFLGLGQLQALSIERNSGLCFPDTGAFASWLRGFESAGPFCHSEDRAALVALYESTGGPNWKRNDNWLSDLPLHDWYGVATDSLGRVAGIDLLSNNLVGSIPSEFGDLSRLGHLDLSNNRLTGPVPSGFGQFAELRWLILHGNQLIGQIPDSFLQLGRLQAFTADVHNCVPSTTAFTAWLKRIPDREATLCADADRAVLEILYNATDGPNWNRSTNWTTDWTTDAAPLGDWHGVTTDASGRVTRVELGGNNLTGTLPDELGDLATVTVLDLSENNLNGTIPGQLGNLSGLRTLALGRNNLNGPIPPELGNLANLTELYLRDNPLLSGPLPLNLAGLQLGVFWYFNTDLCVPADAKLRAWLGNIRDHNGPVAECATERDILMELYDSLGGPGWTESDNWDTNAALSDWHGVTVDDAGRVSALHLPQNNLSGVIPAKLGRLGALRTLALHQNNLTGPIPPELVNLTHLGDLNLWGNRLSGSIPPELGNLASLWQLSLAGNRLSGPIPPELGNLNRIVVLQFHQNNLTGPIPDSFLQLQRLQNFYADVYNCVPETAAFRTWLRRIADHGATLCAAADRAALERLYEATAGPNWTKSTRWLTDAPLGDWYGVTTDASGRVVDLDLFHNELIGQIPPDLGNLANLEELDLSWNDLYGPIPSSLLLLERLTVFRAGGYNCVPKTTAFEQWLERIPDHRASYCADQERRALERLYETTGGPKWTNRQNWMTDAPLGQWHGVTVDSEGYVTELSLEANNLTGQLTNSLAFLARLRRLYLTGNHLEGSIPPALGYLPHLEFLSLKGNSLSGGVPPELGRLANLQYLYLSENRLIGEIPRDFTLLCNLKQLYLDRNGLYSLPMSAHPCFGRSLEVLHLHDNDFKGPFPLWLEEQLKSLTYLTLSSLDRTCLPANDKYRAWVHDLHERRALAQAPHTPAWCGEGFWYTWRFEQTTTGRSWTGKRPYAAHRIRGEPMLLRIFMGMDNNRGHRSIPSPRLWVIFNGNLLTTVEVPEGAIPMSTTSDRAHSRDPFYRESINILVPGHFVDRGDTESIQINFDLDGSFRQLVGNRMPALGEDPEFAPADWVRHIEYRQHYDIMWEGRVPTKTGWFTQEMPPLKVYLMPLVKSISDDRGMIEAAINLVRAGSKHSFFRQTRDLLPVRELRVYTGTALQLGYHPNEGNKGWALAAMVSWEALTKWDEEFDHIVGLMPTGAGIANFVGNDLSVVGYNGGSYRNSLAHELGHNMGLKHAPCGIPGGVVDRIGIDNGYPWRDGRIGGVGVVRGIDLSDLRLGSGHIVGFRGDTIRSIDRPALLDPDAMKFIVPGDTPDLMSYCRAESYPYKWISAYHFDKALNHRKPATSPPQVAVSAPTDVLVVRGGQKPSGELFLWPSLVGETRPTRISGGPYSISGHDERGAELFSFGFEMPQTADGDGTSYFALAVPVRQEWANTLVRISLEGPEGSVTLDRDSGPPTVLVRDATGEIRGILLNVADDALSTSDIAAAVGERSIEGWEIQISRGIPNASYWRR